MKNDTGESLEAGLDAPMPKVMSMPTVVNHEYINLTEQKVQQELLQQEQMLLQAQANFEAFQLNNSAVLNLIRLARLGLIASEAQNSTE